MGFWNFQFIIKSLGKLAERFPEWVIDRRTQLALDMIAALAAILGALALRFEFQLSRFLPAYLLWLPTIAILRPLLLHLMGSYRSTWRHFHLADGLNLAGNSAIITMLLVAFRAFGSFGLPFRALPFGVAILELSLFVAFAGSLRILRRLTYAATHSRDEVAQRAIIVSDNVSGSGRRSPGRTVSRCRIGWNSQ